MTPASQHQQAVVEDLTTSPDPCEHMPTIRAHVDWRTAGDLTDTVFELLGLDTAEPAKSPYPGYFTESLFLLVANALLAASIAIPVAITTSTTIAVIVGIVVLVTGVVLVGLVRRGDRAKPGAKPGP